MTGVQTCALPIWEILLREILNNKRLGIKPVGFIDDDFLKVGKKLLGYPVLGSFKELEEICKKYSVQGLLKSFNHQDSEKHEKIGRFCRDHDIFLKQFSVHLSAVDLSGKKIIEKQIPPPPLSSHKTNSE